MRSGNAMTEKQEVLCHGLVDASFSVFYGIAPTDWGAKRSNAAMPWQYPCKDMIHDGLRHGEQYVNFIYSCSYACLLYHEP